MVRRSYGQRIWYLVFILPVVGTLWVPFYDSIEPRLAGIPYFYWYQFLWIGIGAVLTAIVYFATADASSSERPAGDDTHPRGPRK
jgi:hypothetical protein